MAEAEVVMLWLWLAMELHGGCEGRAWLGERRGLVWARCEDGLHVGPVDVVWDPAERLIDLSGALRLRGDLTGGSLTGVVDGRAVWGPTTGVRD